LDNQPLATSSRMLLQVMSEEKASGFETEPAGEGLKRIVNIGTDPWLVKELKGSVRLKRSDAAQLEVTPLDFNGYTQEASFAAAKFDLKPATMYYLIGK
jgi:hypothetical protein